MSTSEVLDISEKSESPGMMGYIFAHPYISGVVFLILIAIIFMYVYGYGPFGGSKKEKNKSKGKKQNTAEPAQEDTEKKEIDELIESIESKQK